VRFALAALRDPGYFIGMPSAYDMMFATALAGFAAGPELRTFLAAAVAAAFAAWLISFPAGSEIRIFANLDPLNQDCAILQQAVREAVARIQATKRPVSLRIGAHSNARHSAIQFDLTREGDLEISRSGNRPWKLRQPGVWIADHSLPLALPQTRCLPLHLSAAGKERVRASLARPRPIPVWVWIGSASLAVIACAADLNGVLAATLGFACQAYLLEHHAHRPHQKPKIHGERPVT